MKLPTLTDAEIRRLPHMAYGRTGKPKAMCGHEWMNWKQVMDDLARMFRDLRMIHDSDGRTEFIRALKDNDVILSMAFSPRVFKCSWSGSRECLVLTGPPTVRRDKQFVTLCAWLALKLNAKIGGEG